MTESDKALSIQLTELHYRDRPDLDVSKIKPRIEAILSCKIDVPNANKPDGLLHIFHKQHPVEYREGRIPAQTSILVADQPPEFGRYVDDLQQSWRCAEASDLLRQSKYTLLTTELMARGLPPRDRLHLFHGVLQAVVELTQPHALVFKHSQQVINPSSYLDACDEPPELRPGTINVRFFNISNSDGDMIMDTRGLEEVGLHDLQCHFRRLEPNDVMRVLYNTAIYIAENGPVIKAGQTVMGIQPESKWQCQFENSLLEPKRELLDLYPGRPYAAGNR